MENRPHLKSAQAIRLFCFAAFGALFVGNVVAIFGVQYTDVPGQAWLAGAGGVFLAVFAVSLYVAEEDAVTAFGRWQTGSLVLLAITVVGFATGAIAGQVGPAFGVLGLVLGGVAVFLTYSYVAYGRGTPARPN